MSDHDSARLRGLLADFAAGHPGVRARRLFGRPALFAGRRAFACLADEGLRCRLPAEAARAAWERAGRPAVLAGRRDGEWVVFAPPPRVALGPLVPVLEMAAAHTAGMTN